MCHTTDFESLDKEIRYHLEDTEKVMQMIEFFLGCFEMSRQCNDCHVLGLMWEMEDLDHENNIKGLGFELPTSLKFNDLTKYDSSHMCKTFFFAF